MKQYTTIEEITSYLDTLPGWIWEAFSDELGSKAKIAKHMYYDRGDFSEKWVGTPQTERLLEEKMESVVFSFLQESCRTLIVYTAMTSDGYDWPFDENLEAEKVLAAFRVYDVVKEEAAKIWKDIYGQERKHLDGFFAILARLIVRKSDYQDFADAVEFAFASEIRALQDALRALKEETEHA